MFKKIKQLFRRGWVIKLKSSEAHYQQILQRLRDNQPFTFSRWGDGEWESVLNLKEQTEANCDGHQFFPAMAIELQNILKRKAPYTLGMQRLAYHKLMGRQIDQFLKVNNIATELHWEDADVFHNASLAGKILPFFDVLKNKTVILVGPKYLAEFSHFKFDFVEVPAVNCWLERDRILQEITKIVAEKKVDAVLFCAGMTSNWMIDQLHGKVQMSIIDIGSLLDPFVGKQSRNYHKKLADKYSFVKLVE